MRVRIGMPFTRAAAIDHLGALMLVGFVAIEEMRRHLAPRAIDAIEVEARRAEIADAPHIAR